MACLSSLLVCVGRFLQNKRRRGWSTRGVFRFNYYLRRPTLGCARSRAVCSSLLPTWLPVTANVCVPERACATRPREREKKRKDYASSDRYRLW